MNAKLTADQTVELHQWMSENRERILKDGLTSVAVANEAQEALGYSISPSSVKGRGPMLKLRFDKGCGAVDLDPPDEKSVLGGLIEQIGIVESGIGKLERRLDRHAELFNELLHITRGTNEMMKEHLDA